MMKGIIGQIGLFEQLSAYGEPLRRYPKDSILNTFGCGKNYCFSCAKHSCKIRLEERYCRYAPMGAPFHCETMKKELIFRESCQFVNQALAYHRAGDGLASPCCVECEDKCDLECRRSKEKI